MQLVRFARIAKHQRMESLPPALRRRLWTWGQWGENEARFGYGILTGDTIQALRSSPFGQIDTIREVLTLDQVQLLAPCEPTKIIALGLNYRDHAAEFGREVPDEPLIFMKPSTSVIGPEADIVYPKMARRVDYEAELAVVMGRVAFWVPEENALDYVLGYTCFNDVTARDLQKKDSLFTRAKGFDTFAPMGPWIETEIADPDRLTVEAYLNGERRQYSNTGNMVFGVRRLISFISQVMTLLPGDVIATGTPAGVGPMHPGDVIEVRVEGIGTLRNQLVSEEGN
jgi:2-keto-4-pentenoate hydratase/2-oxohepta-3-ene-1,7-dioic acid hydratase in catechol pathway